MRGTFGYLDIFIHKSKEAPILFKKRVHFVLHCIACLLCKDKRYGVAHHANVCLSSKHVLRKLGDEGLYVKRPFWPQIVLNLEIIFLVSDLDVLLHPRHSQPSAHELYEIFYVMAISHEGNYVSELLLLQHLGEVYYLLLSQLVQDLAQKGLRHPQEPDFQLISFPLYVI